MGRKIIGGLLGTAAGIALVPAAQAADLPVKAKPVEYVKICSAYGAGFYYIPGTDICLRVGGAVRADYYHHATGAFPHISHVPPGNPGTYNRDENSHAFRGRGYWILDARQNTAYGTLRAFLNGYISWTTSTTSGGNPSDAINADRAFIQFAGFTFGRAASFFDFYSFTGAYANLVTYNSSSTGATGWNVLAYTAQFGNGVSATISLEDERRKAVYNFVPALPANYTPGGYTSFRAGTNVPAIVGNIRVDQSWGSAQIMGAIQEVRGTYVGGNSGTPQLGSDWGYAFGGGFTWNNPSAPGSVFGIQANWAKGATSYVAHTYTNHAIYETNNKASVGLLVDAVAIGPTVTDLELTEAWGVNVGYQHRFNPNWAWSIGGGYTSVEYGPRANTFLCGVLAGNAPGCLDFSFWSVGSRLLWTPVAGLNIGLDVMYQNYESQFAGLQPAGLVAAGGSRPACGTGGALCDLGDQGVWSTMLRVQRDF